ncbi:MAG: hypothetical protein ACFFF4_11430 [Candidatus Thorarchaeota archaeon]
MHTLRMKDVGIKVLMDFLRRNFGTHGAQVWECKESIKAVFHHQQYLAPSYTVHLVSIVIEYESKTQDAICIIYAGDARNKKHDTMTTEELEKYLGQVIKNEFQLDADVLGNRRYCTKCGTWETYPIKQDQFVVKCKRCGLEISLEEN